MDELLNEIIAREGRKDTNDPNDPGGETKFGISKRYNPDAWKNGPPTLEQAKDIYLHLYIIGPGIHTVTPPYLMDQLADFAVLSGPTVAIQNLQKAINAPVDGKMGPATLKALSVLNPESVNTLLVRNRVLSLSRVVQARPADVQYLFGWMTRALSFLRP